MEIPATAGVITYFVRNARCTYRVTFYSVKMLHSLLNSRLKAINNSFVEVLKKIFRACLIHSTVYWVCCVLPLVEFIGT